MTRLVRRQQNQQSQHYISPESQTHDAVHSETVVAASANDTPARRSFVSIDQMPFAEAISWRGLQIEEHDDSAPRRLGKTTGNEVRSLQAVLDSRFEDLLQLHSALSSFLAEHEVDEVELTQKLNQEQRHACISIPLVCMVHYLGRYFRVTTERGSASTRGSHLVYGLEKSTENPEQSSLHGLDALPAGAFKRGLAGLGDHLGVRGGPPTILSALHQATRHSACDTDMLSTSQVIHQDEASVELRVRHAYDPSIGGPITTNLSVLRQPQVKVKQGKLNMLAKAIAQTDIRAVDDAMPEATANTSFPLSISSQCRLQRDDARVYLTRCSQLFPPIPPTLTLWALIVPAASAEPCRRLHFPSVMSHADACDFVAEKVFAVDNGTLLETQRLFNRDGVQLLYAAGPVIDGVTNARATRLLSVGDPDSVSTSESVTEATHVPAVVAKPTPSTAKASSETESNSKTKNASAAEPTSEAAATSTAIHETPKAKRKKDSSTHLVLPNKNGKGYRFWKMRIEGTTTITEIGKNEE